jgi:hypothetical protein
MTPEDFPELSGSSEPPGLHDDLGRLAADLSGGPMDLAMLRSRVDRRAKLIRVRRGAAAAVAVAAVGLAYPAYAAVASQDVAKVKLAPVSPHGSDLQPTAEATSDGPGSVGAPTLPAVAPSPAAAPSSTATSAASAATVAAPPVKKSPAAPLRVWIAADRTTIHVGQTVTFTLSWSDGDGRGTGDAYDFGNTGLGADQVSRDGTCYTGANAGKYTKQDTYEEPGVYKAYYQVLTTACSGDENVFSTPIYITVLPAPTPSPTTSPSATPTDTSTTAPASQPTDTTPPGTAVG